MTCDVERRLAQHNGAIAGGAKSTRAGRPWQLDARVGPFAARGDALSAEYRLKRLPGARRVAVASRAGAPRDAIGWKKVPKAHHPLFYAALPADRRVEAFEVLGGVAIRVGGHTAGGLFSDSVVVRLSPSAWAKAARIGGAPFVPVGRALMKDMILLPKGTLDNRAKTQRWLQLAIDFTATLPPKKKTAKKKTAKKKTAKKKTAKKKTAKKR